MSAHHRDSSSAEGRRRGRTAPRSRERSPQQRRQWGKAPVAAADIADLGGQGPAVEDDVSPEYSEYLRLLSERNKILQRLKQKDDKQIAKEKREHGFSLYVNGANDLKTTKKGQAARLERQYNPDTAPRAHKHKSRSAPSSNTASPTKTSPKRRGWKPNTALRIRAHEGEDAVIHVPEKISGEYADDFDSGASSVSSSDSDSDGVDDSFLPSESGSRHDLSLSFQAPSVASSVEIVDEEEEEGGQGESPRPSRSRLRGSVGASASKRLSFRLEDIASVRSSLQSTAGVEDVLSDLELSGLAQDVENLAVSVVIDVDDLEKPTMSEEQRQHLVAELAHLEAVASSPSSAPRPAPLQPDAVDCEADGVLRRSFTVASAADLNRTQPLGHTVARARRKGNKTVDLRLKSNWSDWGQETTDCGLTEVQFLDGRGVPLCLSPDNVRVDGRRDPEAGRLLNGRTDTVDPAHMWRGTPAGDSGTITLRFLLPVDFGLSEIRVWNYNAPRDLAVGAYQAEAYVSGSLMWSGRLDKGLGTTGRDYSSSIEIEVVDGPDPVRGTADNRARAHRPRNQVLHSKSAVTLQAQPDAAASLPTRPATHAVVGAARERRRRRGDHPAPAPAATPAAAGATEGMANPFADLTFMTPKKVKNQARSRSAVTRTTPSPRGEEAGGSPQPVRAASAQRARRLSSPALWLPADALSKSRSLGDLRQQPANAPAPRDSLDFVQPRADRPQPQERPSRASSGGVRRPADSPRATETPTKTPGIWKRDGSLGDMMQAQPLSAGQRSSGSLTRFPATASPRQSIESLALFETQKTGRLGLPDGGAPRHDYADDTHSEGAQQTSDTEGNAGPGNEFAIPELPRGRELALNIASTWGDRHYVGLTGLQVFDANGDEVTRLASATANPADINVLSGNSNDPRVVSNLVDGVNRTCDDVHMWLAPFCPGTDHWVRLTFPLSITLAIVRVWNYNKSRVHTSRGARDVAIYLDGRPIFEGEIAQASGNVLVEDAASYGETILFTTDDEILEACAAQDELLHEVDLLSQSLEAESLRDAAEMAASRPSTADEDPSTGGAGANDLTLAELAFVPDESVMLSRIGGLVSPAFRGQLVHLMFTETWGDPYYLGLSGLELITHDGQNLQPAAAQLDASPRDLSALSGGRDVRTLDKLVNGTNVTTDDVNMWLIPFTHGADHTLTIDLGALTTLSGLRVWNYNKSEEDTCRGAQVVHVTIDGHSVSPAHGFVLRKAPGHADYDFGQTIAFGTEGSAPASREGRPVDTPPAEKGNVDRLIPGYVTCLSVVGLHVRIRIQGTCGDPHYVGLTALEPFGVDGSPIPLRPDQVQACPHSINTLEGVASDVRTPDKLVDGVHASPDGRHSWLAPFVRADKAAAPNTIEVLFDAPTCVGGFRFWNYDKTPGRGVGQFQIWVDGRIVFDGSLRPSFAPSHTSAPYNTSPMDRHQSVVFTSDKRVLEAERPFLTTTGPADVAELGLFDEGSRLSKPAASSAAAEAFPEHRPKTSTATRH